MPQGSQVVEKAVVVGEVYPSSTACGAFGTPSLSLASVARSPPIDERTVIQDTVGPAAALGFDGVMLGALSLVACRRGVSLFQDLGSSGWGIALLTIVAASLFSSLVTTILITPHNYPVDWTPVVVHGTVFAAVGIVIFIVARREIIREGVRRRPPGA